ncbi:hypothetical protein FOL47_007150 [Perkinsus chesapeaki]|uniref:Uncharacterized protein n=1 Tax=Perkinsus chesapeaki TaxID=330153 RepID=A0A7J6LN02_PERCH|nr:hypothetical protein FOL47_007150 [Perkinsus chesapeaki]
MPHCTASLLAGLQHKTADEVIPQELTALTWKYLTRRVFIPTLSPTCLKTIETRLDRLVLQDKQSMDLVADSGVAYFKSEDDSKIFVLDKLGKMLHPRSLQGSGLMMQLAGIEPESAALYTFQWNSSKGVMELHVDSSDRSDEPECCWSADGLLQARPLFAACGRNIFVANCGLQGSNPVAAIDVKCSVGNGDDDPDKWIKILAPLPGELIRAISVHACKDTSRIICAMEHSIWVTDLCLTTLSHGAPIVWTKIGNLAEGERVSQLVGISDNVVVGLFTRSGGLRTLRSIDLVNGVFKDIMSMKEEQVSMFLTKDHIWMASMIDEGVPQFAVVDLEWI